MDAILGILAVFALVFINGFFVAAEFSLVGARRTRITQLAEEGNAGAKSAENAINSLDSYIAATQLGITLASLGLGWIGEPAVAHVIEPIFEKILPESAIEAVSVAIGFSFVTTLHIVLGELAPKSIALQRPEGTAIIISRPTTIFLRLFRPVIWIMNHVGNSVVRLIGFEPAGGHAQVHSAEELEMLVRSSREAGYLQESEEKLLRRVFDFADIHVEEVMQPRVDIEGIALDTPTPELLKQISTRHHSRFPIYQNSIDQIVGFLHIKDIFDALVENPDIMADGSQILNLQTLLRKPLYVPGAVTVDILLEKMRLTRTHFAVVIDEYGGVAGIITMEDIFEELVGEVQDEFDEENSPIVESKDTTIVDGQVSVSEIIDRFGDPETPYISTTIGGYIAENLSRIPKVGDSVHFGRYTVYVKEMADMRVAKVQFVHDPDLQQDEEEKHL
jgi:CBS domain containing-hemolysin-like protein